MLTALLLAAALAVEGEATLQCPGMTTYEMNMCVIRENEAAEAQLARYRLVARDRLLADKSVPRATLRKFDAAEKAWQRYREQECAALGDYWSGGTIRGAMAGSCWLELTRARTRILWLNWLHYADSTPPILPDPAPSKAPQHAND